MIPLGSSFLTVSRRDVFWAWPEPEPSIVVMRGEHDASTMSALSETLARAIALDDADLVIDLSEVEFMSSATVGVIMRTRQFLEKRSRTLSLRSPPACVLRVFEVCGLSDLLEPSAVGVAGLTGAAPALGSWVAVPLSERAESVAGAGGL
jgi:anti-anti-sigma factor